GGRRDLVRDEVADVSCYVEARRRPSRRLFLVPDLAVVQVDFEAAAADRCERDRQVVAESRIELGRHPGGRGKELSGDTVLDLDVRPALCGCHVLLSYDT